MHPFVHAGRPALILAPMEGVTDAPMRALFSERGGFTYCVGEFLRISQNVPPPRTYLEHLPELENGAATPAGTPIQVQLLGGDPERLAEAALRAVECGSPGVDLNFGCPARTVNRHDGGATLLKFPERIRSIVSAVRAALPPEVPVSAKLRLGWDSHDPVHRNADMAAEGGAAWITIHGRTKMQGYAPPIHWEPIGEVRRRLASGRVPVVANGDIWTFEDFLRCRDITGSEHFMIGRGALANPHLSWQIAHELGLPGGREVGPFAAAPEDWLPLIERFSEICLPRGYGDGYVHRRVKQWLRMNAAVDAQPWFTALKRSDSLERAMEILGAAVPSPVAATIAGPA